MTDTQVTAGALEMAREAYRREREKRVRDEGNEQFIDTDGVYSDFQRDHYADPDFTRDPITETVEVVIVGGGIGGLLAGARLREAGYNTIRVIEKGSDFGGTWYWNRYPGAQCDTESYIYLPLLEELGFVPSEKYAHQPEILDHLRSVGRHYGLYDGALFQTTATDMAWDEAEAEWVLSTDRGDQIRAKYLILSTGDQHKPRLPAVPGILSFAGKMFHTSRWDREYAGDDLSGLAGKRVGVIGTGATGVQVIPNIAAHVGELLVFQRTPATISVRDNKPTGPDWASALEPGWQHRRSANFTACVTGVAVENDLVGDAWTRTMMELNAAAAGKTDPFSANELVDFAIMERIRSRVDESVRDPDAAAALKPFYRFNCKRPTFNDDYLPAFNLPNVRLIDTGGRGVERITPDGIIVDGELHELDVLVFATGFDVGTAYTHSRSFDLVGRGGVRLSERWANGMRTFHGLHGRGFPNCFFLGFTQTGFSPNFTHTLNEQASHLGYLLSALRERGVGVVEPSQQAEDEWVRTIREGRSPSQLKFLRECTPSYTNGEGKPDDENRFVAGRYPGGPIEFFAVLARWREADSLEGLELTPAGTERGEQDQQTREPAMARYTGAPQ
ncbi:NAD(P)/FAD-dependent oxidoreductase [Salinibacterium sp. ZJ450]|uniref:flavin-containing monooxygenase n=1 Tax=Salinibacterium sp. ZJ450 TaxID=2708338 RepID=UPI001423F76C|nr:NAD(P)/FAD-dependent oxidoreductase [Salinibacterium sp. ZJ450]